MHGVVAAPVERACRLVDADEDLALLPIEIAGRDHIALAEGEPVEGLGACGQGLWAAEPVDRDARAEDHQRREIERAQAIHVVAELASGERAPALAIGGGDFLSGKTDVIFQRLVVAS